MKRFDSLRKYFILFAVSAVLTCSVTSCNNESENKDTNPPVNADNTLSMPDGQDKTEEIITNENYADSELYDFTGTVDEIYEDGSILVYSPDFRVNFDYKVIVEFDENTVIDNFTLAENQHIRFDVYSSVKKSEPLTVVAAKLTLLNEVSTQREEEAQRIAELEKKIENIA